MKDDIILDAVTFKIMRISACTCLSVHMFNKDLRSREGSCVTSDNAVIVSANQGYDMLSDREKPEVVCDYLAKEF